MHFTPDEIIFLQYGFFKINSTILTTWIIMLFMLLVSIPITRNLEISSQVTRWQCLLEVIIKFGRDQLQQMGIVKPDICIPFVVTIFLFIVVSTLSGIIPGVYPPTASLSTTAALSVCVFCAIPIYGVAQSGLKAYLHRYIEPTWIMLPFHLIGEISRTVSLAVRLFGNAMSESMVVAVCLTVAPLFFPILMKVLGILTGFVQAYIFAMLAALYIAAGIKVQYES